MPDTPLLTAYAQSLTPTPGNVYCMDALDGLRRLPSGSIDMMLTSPPYDNLRIYNGYSFDFEGIARESYRTLKDSGVLVWVTGDETVEFSETFTSLRQALYFRDVVGFNALDTMAYVKQSYTPAYPSLMRYANQFEYMFVFSKGKPSTFNPFQTEKSEASTGPKGFRQRNGSIQKKTLTDNGRDTKDASNVWIIDVGFNKSGDTMSHEHPATFPEELARRHILTWSNPGDVVCDPFSGAGTTWKECMKADRQFIGFEISEEYCNLSRRRIANWRRDSDIEVSPGVVQMGLFANTA